MKNVAIIGNHGSGQTTAATGLQLCCGYDLVTPAPMTPPRGKDPWGHVGRVQRDPEAEAHRFCQAMVGALQDVSQPFVLDGFPRTIAQWLALEQLVPESIAYVYLVCPTYLCARRLLRRDRISPATIAQQFALFEVGVLPLIHALEEPHWLHNNGDEGMSPTIAHLVERLKLIAEVPK